MIRYLDTGLLPLEEREETVFEAMIRGRLDARVGREPCLWALEKERGGLCGCLYASGGEAVVSAGEAFSDWEELTLFLLGQGVRTVTGDEAVISALRLLIEETGPFVQAFKGSIMEDGGEMLPLIHREVEAVTRLGEIYPLICGVKPGFEEENTFGEWYTGVSHKVRHGQAHVYGIPREGRYVAAGGIYAIGREKAVLGGICVEEGFRRKGLAGMVVNRLVRKCRELGKQAVLLAADNAAQRLYEKGGFQRSGLWGELRFQPNRRNHKERT